jgi:hypothetical protein
MLKFPALNSSFICYFMTPPVSRLHSVDDMVINEHGAVGGLILRTCISAILKYMYGDKFIIRMPKYVKLHQFIQVLLITLPS